LEDALSGEQFEVNTRAVVNATGPWSDRVPHSNVKLRLTKGVHLVVDRARLAVPETVVMTDAKRILFAIPWGERTILGTTDTDYSGNLDEIEADQGDIANILSVVHTFFPAIRLTSADVISTWAGVRPLLADPNGNPSDISRSHEIRRPQPGWWDVAGGKLTTYRLMAEQTIDAIVKEFRSSNGGTSTIERCRTAVEPLLRNEPTTFSSLVPPALDSAAVRHYCAKEWAIHLDDVMVRRTGWHYYFADAHEKAEQVADWMTESLGWSDSERATELGRYRQRTRLPAQMPP
jgi:glycerol-3-phosphate dehydrogenase